MKERPETCFSGERPDPRDPQSRAWRNSGRGLKPGEETARLLKGFTFSTVETAARKFHRALHISYPSAQDRAQAVRQVVSLGGDVFVHGLPNGYGWIGKGHCMKD
jgi:hypothetical protein